MLAGSGSEIRHRMVIGLLNLDIHIPYAHSLKDKRMVVRRIKDRLRAKFNVAVAEVDHQELWQRIRIGVVSVGSDQGYVQELMRFAAEEAEHVLPGCTVWSEIELM